MYLCVYKYILCIHTVLYPETVELYADLQQKKFLPKLSQIINHSGEMMP